MDRIVLLSSPQEFPSFELTHWMDGPRAMFGVAWGWSFTDFYSAFSAAEFSDHPDRPEIEIQLQRVNALWFLNLLRQLSAGEQLSSQDILGIAQASVGR